MDIGIAEVEELDIVIVGAGICGLATALALHRNGIRSVVLERSDTLRTSGVAFGILGNGWRALSHLGVAQKIRGDSILLQGVGESRCVKRSNLIQGLAEDLPHGTVRCGCHIQSIKKDPLTSSPILHLTDGRTIKAKVLIGCDGANSVVAQYLKLKPKKVFPKCGVRGLTSYPNGHGLPPEIVRIYTDDMLFGRSPINENEVYWFLLLPGHPQNLDFKDQELVRQMCVENIKGQFPDEVVRMVEECDASYLFLQYVTYRTPWDMVVGRFREGTVTVAGDAMHIMGPFLGQGSSVALEDGVVLGRCLARKIHDQADFQGNQSSIQKKVGEAMDAFVRERRMRLVGLSTHTYLTGLLMATLPKLVKLFIVLLKVVFYHDSVQHTRYDCGPP
ncbi:hypothetical protein FNV43_RR19216 [Rhamnella rubrinervis]|uniref:FAD-binding domain-containing protein n=1 Tax=Rhamnella rubrinervis TaxID=2594499 RepID=A0A8K0E0R6_9ROSA|nr:hypothetical protein FNV43_RR19216 [Rhamnella rubrinervis]